MSKSDAHIDVAAKRRPDLSNALCRQVADRQRAHDNLLNNPVAQPARFVYQGEISGLRIALCLLHGWDPELDSDIEGPADELVREWQDNEQVGPADGA